MSAQVGSEDDDPVDAMLKRTGCLHLHHRVQECMAETKDWRQCQDVVKEFKHCMQKYSSNLGEKRGQAAR